VNAIPKFGRHPEERLAVIRAVVDNDDLEGIERLGKDRSKRPPM
jgi:hypothetical protein